MKPTIDIHRYNTIIFDCDGVILNSNRIKSDAFYQAALAYGEPAAAALRQYHIERGGISRYAKFEHFLNGIVGMDATPSKLQSLLDHYQAHVLSALASCEVTKGLAELRASMPDATWMVASGGDQAELRTVFQERQIDSYFDGGIFGSPTPKVTILERERAAGRIPFPALFLGDSEYDHTAARQIGSDFVFVSAWTEFEDWRRLHVEYGFPVVERVADLIPDRPRTWL